MLKSLNTLPPFFPPPVDPKRIVMYDETKDGPNHWAPWSPVLTFFSSGCCSYYLPWTTELTVDRQLWKLLVELDKYFSDTSGITALRGDIRQTLALWRDVVGCISNAICGRLQIWSCDNQLASRLFRMTLGISERKVSLLSPPWAFILSDCGGRRRDCWDASAVFFLRAYKWVHCRYVWHYTRTSVRA